MSEADLPTNQGTHDHLGSRRRALVSFARQLLLSGVLAWKLAMCWHGNLDCSTAARSGPPAIAVSVCLREYQETRVPLTGVRLANAMRETGDLDGASAIANGLIATSARSDAFYILGKIATQRGRTDEAMTFLECARTMHLAEGKPGDVARDDQALAGLYADREQFAEALSILDECIASSHAGTEPTLESYCHLSAARVLSRVGYFEIAHKELDRAAPLTKSDRNHAWLELERGNLDQELERTPRHIGHDTLAIIAFENVLKYAAKAQLPDLTLTAELNLAHSLAEVGRPDDAERHLAIAAQLDWKHEREAPLTWLAARIAYKRGNLALAWSLNERVYPTVTDSDDRLDIAVLQTRIALASGDLARAEHWAKNGIKDAEKTRDAQSAVELRPWVLSTRREPYELLFATHARAGRIEEVLLAFDQWQGRTLLDTMARPSPLASLDLRSVASRVAQLARWLPITSNAPLMQRDNRAAIAALHDLDLLALAVADGDVWVVSASRGKLGIRKLGSLTSLAERFAQFEATPTEPTLAAELGELILDDETARATGDVLHILLDGALAELPLVALRRHGRPLITVRPVLRVLRLPETACVPVARTAQATVIADATGDLGLARSEAAEVVALLGATSHLGAQATSKALFAVNHDATLHIAIHGKIDAGGGTLVLYDQAVSAPEISARKLGPSLVMLSTCVSAASDDGELAGSLATAFLAAGSSQVVATLRTVSDVGARELATRFYRASGVADPVRALARVQAVLAATGNTDWPNFAVFGHDVCRSTH